MSEVNLALGLWNLKLGNGALQTTRTCDLCFRGVIQTTLSSCIGKLGLEIADNSVIDKRIAKSAKHLLCIFVVTLANTIKQYEYLHISKELVYRNGQIARSLTIEVF